MLHAVVACAHKEICQGRYYFHFIPLVRVCASLLLFLRAGACPSSGRGDVELEYQHAVFFCIDEPILSKSTQKATL